jgi:hypothetical protein
MHTPHGGYDPVRWVDKADDQNLEARAMSSIVVTLTACLLLAVPLAVEAQQAGQALQTVGVLTPQRLEQQAAYPTFRETSRLLGYKEGSNLRVLERGFISYTFDPVGLYARTAVVVDRILKGAKPGDLPVEQSTKFESTINLKTAKALGIDIPGRCCHGQIAFLSNLDGTLLGAAQASRCNGPGLALLLALRPLSLSVLELTYQRQGATCRTSKSRSLAGKRLRVCSNSIGLHGYPCVCG